MLTKIPLVCLMPATVSHPTLRALSTEIVEKPRREVIAALATRGTMVLGTPAGIWSVKNEGLLLREWKRVRVGTTMLFASQRMLFARCTIVAKLESSEIAEIQWPNGGAEEPCLLLYSKPIACRIPIEDVARALAHKPGYLVRHFTTLQDLQATRVLELLTSTARRH